MYQIYLPPYGRGDILHISRLLRKREICGNISPRAGRDIQIHTGVIAYINQSLLIINACKRLENKANVDMCNVSSKNKNSMIGFGSPFLLVKREGECM